jgi:hypothetical protein
VIPQIPNGCGPSDSQHHGIRDLADSPRGRKEPQVDVGAERCRP